MIDIDTFFNAQLTDWDNVRNNYRHLEQVLYRNINFPYYTLTLQYNPERIRSTSAKTDANSIQARPCFLCSQNMPTAQKSLNYNTQYDIRVNPYPIFNRHFTVPTKAHMPQLIQEHFNDMLLLAQDIPNYTIFYNGPKSGASAPDHFHFQLAPRHSMPLEKDIITCPKEELLASPRLTIEFISQYIRKNIIIKTQDYAYANQSFQKILAIINSIIPNDPEPMLNLLVWYESQIWTIVIFPRRQHRPWQYFAESKDKIMFSPGCVDFAGLIILPRKEDFDLLNSELLIDLFNQLTINNNEWENLISNIKTSFLTNNTSYDNKRIHH